jgi:TMEM175 potassium channel family protein
VTNPIREPGRSTPFGGERDPVRVVAFSDGVIAIAVTLLVLDIRPPEDTRHLLESLAALWPSYLAYVVTFMLIGQVWANHHVMFDRIRSVDRTVLFLNTVLLMDIAFLPFAASVLASAFRNGQGERTAVALHGLTFEVAAILFNIIWWYARHDRRLLAPSIDAAGVKAIGRRFQPEVAVLVDPRTITGEVDVGVLRPVRLAIALIIVEDATEHRWPWPAEN